MNAPLASWAFDRWQNAALWEANFEFVDSLSSVMSVLKVQNSRFISDASANADDHVNFDRTGEFNKRPPTDLGELRIRYFELVTRRAELEASHDRLRIEVKQSSSQFPAIRSAIEQLGAP